MHLPQLVTSLAAVGVAFSLCLAPVQEGKKGAPQDASAKPEMTPPKPGKQHEPLKKFEGTWDCVVKCWATPDGEATESKGTETNQLICNGLWLESEVQGEMAGSKFEGHALLGWDTGRSRYHSSWVCSMSTEVCLSDGAWDDKAQAMSWTMEGKDMTGKKARFRSTDTLKGDTREMVCYQTGADGKEWKHMTIAYTRKK
jgi:hypothetical protein